LAARKGERARAVARFDDFVPRELEKLPKHRAQHRFVVHKEDLFHASFCDDGS
jgi:hypothetical protein